MRNNFYILLASSDEQMSSTYASKIKERFGELPLLIDFASDGVKALEKFEKKLHHLVISDIDMPVLDGPTLVGDIRKIEGSSVIYLLGDSDPGIDEPGVEFIKTPITNWTEFIGKVEDVIPEEIKIEYGLTKRDTALNRRLGEFSKKFLKENNIEPEPSGENNIFFIPQYFYGVKEISAGDKSSAGKKGRFLGRDDKTKFVTQEGTDGSSFLKKKFLFQNILELLILGGLFYVTYTLFTEKPLEEDDFSEGNP